MNFYSDAVAYNPDFAWQAALKALRAAGGKRSLLLGFGPEPNFIHESAFEAHTYVVGPPGIGKTSRVLAPLLSQRIEMGHPVYCIDCKPDPGLLGHLREAAEAVKRPFYFFSLQPGAPSEFALDLFAPLASREPRHIAEFLVSSLGLNKASEPYFISQNTGAVTEAVRQAKAKGRLSFKSLAHEARGIIASSSKRFEHAVQALDALEALADVPEINPTKGGPLPSVDFTTLVRDGVAAYFCLPVSTEMKLTSAVVGSMLLKLTSTVSKDLALAGYRPRTITFAIDEFQDIAESSDLKEMVAQVRGIGGGISLVLSHQVLEQVSDDGLRALLINAGLLVLLAPRQFAKQLMEWSGEKVVRLWSESAGDSSGSSPAGATSNESDSLSYSETIRPTLDLDTIQLVNRLPGCGFLVDRGPPRAMFFPHHVSRHEADRRAATAFLRRVSAPNAVTCAPQPKPQQQPHVPTAANVKPAAPPTPPLEPLTSRLQKLFVRLCPTTLMSAIRRGP